MKHSAVPLSVDKAKAADNTKPIAPQSHSI